MPRIQRVAVKDYLHLGFWLFQFVRWPKWSIRTMSTSYEKYNFDFIGIGFGGIYLGILDGTRKTENESA